MKPAKFRGSSLEDLRRFPQAAMRDAGYQLDRVQQGLMPTDWKPMPSVGRGVTELRVRDGPSTFRVVYIARMADAIYVLHCFQKKAQQTPHKDIAVATQRHKELLEDLKE